MKILINASNLHVGGGVQVASSFISELIASEFICKKTICIYASSAVYSDLISQRVDVFKYDFIEVFDIFGIKAFNPFVIKRFEKFDAVFTIFGPSYLPIKIKNHIIGFAQPWILHPNNDVHKNLGLASKIKNKLKFAIQWQFFKFSADCLVVELPHVKDRLVKLKGYPNEKIEVVENCFSSIYLEAEKWRPLNLKQSSADGTIRLGYVSRAYLHKNLQILLPVSHALQTLSHRRFEFFVTLTDKEWNDFPNEYRAAIHNAGPLTVAQCPSFYEAMDGVIFTSLLECFSATPLEAMVMRRPLFASDRSFVRDVCAEHAVYVNPMDPHDIARKIRDWFEDTPETIRKEHTDRAYAHVRALPTSRDRAQRYLEIIEDHLKNH